MSTNIDSELSDVQDVYEPYVDESKDETEADYAGGTESLAMPDRSAYGGMMQEITASIRKAIDDERKYYANLDQPIKVNPNISGEIQFSRFDVALQPIMIVKEKRERGNTLITNYGTGSVYIGKHAGIMAGGTDTVTVIANGSRVIRTRRELWCVAATTASIDVQQEFD